MAHESYFFLAGTSILDRYEAHGIPYEMEEDKVVIAGPSWLDFGLKYEPVMNGDQTGKVHNKYNQRFSQMFPSVDV